MKHAIALLGVILLISSAFPVVALTSANNNPAHCELSDGSTTSCCSYFGDPSYDCVTCTQTVGGSADACYSPQPASVTQPPSATPAGPTAAPTTAPSGPGTTAPYTPPSGTGGTPSGTTGTGAPAYPDNSMILGVIIVLILLGAGYWWMTSQKKSKK
ncbi:MAG TPA: hypothetical protein VGQ00_04525 [Candidatus Norongarragalinales archaeon]|jgi:cobalamin biosynthesis Mg chelatase CobN|nr:hypothetical protein [Candidatus Norongarragalinales archaeon]